MIEARHYQLCLAEGLIAEAAEGVLRQRSAGILLHPTSLPDGVIGEPARAFLEFLQIGRAHV